LRASSDSRRFRHGSKGGGSLEVAIAAERNETRSDERSVVDRRLIAHLQVPEQPAGRDSRVTARLPLGDQDRQLEKLGDVGRPSSRSVVSANARLPRSTAL
jgi:hypothetical protein